jgi:hypothetical protein
MRTRKALEQRFGSGDSEPDASMTRQMPYKPLPAFVLLAFFVPAVVVVDVKGSPDDIAVGEVNV